MSGIAARWTAPLVLAVLALVVTAAGGNAASRPRVGMLGVVPHATQPEPAKRALSKAVRAAAPRTLTFDASYERLINQYFTDVAVDSGGTQNVYSVATQYYDNPGAVHIQYQSTFGGSYVDHGPLPQNGCDDGVDTYCLTDRQLQVEIQSVLAAKGWQGGLDHVFFLMTPNGLGSCEFTGTPSKTNPCSTNAFCAYHSFFPTNSQPVIYANEPYMGPLPPGECTNAKDQGFPNDVDADTTINTISHEHNEAITDPLGTGWVENDGTENGDLCAYGFGAQIGGTNGVDAYNQVINNHHYELQQEYSNEDGPPGGGCVQFLGGPSSPPPPLNGSGPLPYNNGPVMHTNTTYAIYWLPTPGNQTAPAVTGRAAVAQTLTTSAGTWNGGASAFHEQWQRCSSAGSSCVNISGATASTYKLTTADGGHTLRSRVTATNVNGASAPATSATTAVVVDVPTATKAPHISGRVRVGKKLTASRGSWTHSPSAYRFRWLRCNAHGGSCVRIGRATRSTYKLAKRDAKHRLRVRVTAVNAAGSTAAISAASARVPLPKKR